MYFCALYIQTKIVQTVTIFSLFLFDTNNWFGLFNINTLSAI